MGTAQNLVRAGYAAVGDVGGAARGGERGGGC